MDARDKLIGRLSARLASFVTGPAIKPTLLGMLHMTDLEPMTMNGQWFPEDEDEVYGLRVAIINAIHEYDRGLKLYGTLDASYPQQVMINEPVPSDKTYQEITGLLVGGKFVPHRMWTCKVMDITGEVSRADWVTYVTGGSTGGPHDFKRFITFSNQRNILKD